MVEQVEGAEVPHVDSVRLHETPDHSQAWYQDRAGRVVVLDEAAEEERDRQQREPDTDPAPGYPKFSRNISIGDIPQTSGIAIPDAANAGTRQGAMTPGDIEAAAMNAAYDPDWREKQAAGAAEYEQMLKDFPRENVATPGDLHEEAMNAEYDPNWRERRAATDAYEEQMVRDFPREHVPDASDIETAAMNEELSRQRATEFAAPEMDQMNRDYDPTRFGMERPAQPDSAPENPAWIGQYFAGGGSWDTFDLKNYAGVIPKSIPELTTRYNQQFGEFVSAVDPSKFAILEKVLANPQVELSAEDRKFVQFAQYEFTKNVQDFERQVEGKFTPKTVEFLMAVNDDFRQIVDEFGVDDAVKVYKQSIFNLGMRDKAHFEQVIGSFKVWNDGAAMERAKKSEDTIQKICDEMKIPRRNFEMMFGIGKEGNDANDPAVRARIVEHLQKEAATFGTTWDWIKLNYKGGYRGKAQRLIEEAHRTMPQHWLLLSPTSWQTSAILGARKDIAGVMANTVSSSEFRNMIDRASFTGEPLPTSPESAGPKTFDQVQGLARSNEYTQGSTEQYIRRRIGTIPDFGSKPAVEQDEILQNIHAEMGGENVRGTGFMSWLFRLFFGQTFTNAANTVMGRNVNLRY